MKSKKTTRTLARKRHRPAILTVVVAALALLLVSTVLVGCGLETDKANEILSRANKYQQEAQEILNRVKNFPAEWEAMFNVTRVGPEQVAQGRQLIAEREEDIAALEGALKKWGKELNSISSLNVEEKIKEYIDLRMNSIECYSDYATNFLRPILTGYSKLVELLAAGATADQLNQAAQEIATIVQQSAEKLQECKGAAKRADDYFKKNKLGK